MRTRRLVISILAMLPVVGCSHDSQATRKESNSAILSGFDSEKDPPVTAQTRYAAGMLAESQNPQAAVTQYKQALKLDPKHLPSLYRLGVVYAQLHQFPEALEVWSRYVKATDNSPDAYANQGFCMELAGRPNDAEQAYRNGLAIDNRNLPCTVNLGLLLARVGREGEALTTLERVLTPAEARYNIASVYEAKGMRAQARLEYQKALALDARFADAKQRLAALPQD